MVENGARRKGENRTVSEMREMVDRSMESRKNRAFKKEMKNSKGIVAVDTKRLKKTAE